jgi:predicted alpha/beta hydrolase
MPTFTFKGRYPVNVQIHPPLSDADQEKTIIFMAATGVRLHKYTKLFSSLTAKGFTVIAADYPCCGENPPQINRFISYNYQDLLDDFIPQLLSHSEHDSIYLMGHSLGGQLATIYSALTDIPAIGVATGNIYFKNWSGLDRLKLRNLGITFTLLTKAYGYFPGAKVGFGGREARGLMHNWCHILKTGGYDFVTGDLDKGRGLYIHIEGDNYSPYPAVKHLASLCQESKIISVKLPEHLKGNPHGVWIKDPDFITDHIDQQLQMLAS